MVHALALGLVDGGVGIGLAGLGVVGALVALVEVVVAGRVVAVVLEAAVAAVRHRVVVVGPVRIDAVADAGHVADAVDAVADAVVDAVVGAVVAVAVGLHLPQRVLRVDRAAVVRVGVAVLRVRHVDPWGRKDKPNQFHSSSTKKTKRTRTYNRRRC